MFISGTTTNTFFRTATSAVREAGGAKRGLQRPYDTGRSELTATIHSGTARGFTLWLSLYVMFHRYWGRESFSASDGQRPHHSWLIFFFTGGSLAYLPFWDPLHAPLRTLPNLLVLPAAVFCQSGPIQGFAIALTVAPLLNNRIKTSLVALYPG